MAMAMRTDRQDRRTRNHTNHTQATHRPIRPKPLTRFALAIIDGRMDQLTQLETTIAARRGGDPATSYVARLHDRGLPLIARKLGEESVEAVVAALSGSRDELIGESADLLFHLLVLLSARDITLAEVLAELERREGTSGIAEKAARSAE